MPAVGKRCQKLSHGKLSHGKKAQSGFWLTASTSLTVFCWLLCLIWCHISNYYYLFIYSIASPERVLCSIHNVLYWELQLPVLRGSPCWFLLNVLNMIWQYFAIYVCTYKCLSIDHLSTYIPTYFLLVIYSFDVLFIFIFVHYGFCHGYHVP